MAVSSSRSTNGVRAAPARLQAGYLALSDDLIDRHRRREALELAPAQIAILEPFRRELPRDFGHDHGVGFGHALQARGEVGRLADNGVTSGMPASASPTTTRPVAMPTRTLMFEMAN